MRRHRHSSLADNFYDNLVSSHQELINVRNYTLKNPERWEDDRFGAVTSFSVGNLELLSSSLVAFVASDTHDKWGVEKPHVRAVREVFRMAPRTAPRTEASPARWGRTLRGGNAIDAGGKK